MENKKVVLEVCLEISDDKDLTTSRNQIISNLITSCKPTKDGGEMTNDFMSSCLRVEKKRKDIKLLDRICNQNSLLLSDQLIKCNHVCFQFYTQFKRYVSLYLIELYEFYLELYNSIEFLFILDLLHGWYQFNYESQIVRF